MFKSIADIRIGPISWIKGAVYACLLVLVYYSTLNWMISHDWARGDYTYCIIIPFIVLYLLWEKRRELTEVPSFTSYAGFVFLAIGILFFWAGELGGELFTLYLSLWFVVVGLIWIHMGRQKIKVLAFPLIVVLAMFPFPSFINTKINFQLRLVSSKIGVWLLHLFGESAYREGNVIDLGFTRLQVVDACSGLRFIIPLMVLALMLAYWFKAYMWKRVVLFLSSIPLAIFFNSFRIAATGIIHRFFGAEVAEGFFHGFSGWIIFMCAIPVLLFEMWILKSINLSQRHEEHRDVYYSEGQKKEKNDLSQSHKEHRDFYYGEGQKKEKNDLSQSHKEHRDFLYCEKQNQEKTQDVNLSQRHGEHRDIYYSEGQKKEKDDLSSAFAKASARQAERHPSGIGCTFHGAGREHGDTEDGGRRTEDGGRRTEDRDENKGLEDSRFQGCKEEIREGFKGSRAQWVEVGNAKSNDENTPLTIYNSRFTIYRSLLSPVFLTSVAILLLTFGLSQGIEFREKAPLSKSFSQFPLSIGAWNGEGSEMEAALIDELDLSDYVIIDYRNPAGKTVNFYTAYYESQRKGESIHSPETCLPGSGWEFKEAETVSLTLNDSGSLMTVNRSFMEKAGEKQLVYFWFPMRGRILTNIYQMKIYNFWDALTRQRTDGALVRVITPVYNGEEVRDADERLAAFVREVEPVLVEFLPK